MFFQTTDISAKILSVLRLEWAQQYASSGIRPFHALSFRIRGNTEFATENDSPIHFSNNEIAFVPANLVYTQAAKNERLFVIHFTCEAPMPNTILKFTPQNPIYFEIKFTDIYNAWMKHKPESEYECKAIFYKILFAIEKEWNNRPLLDGIQDIIMEAREYIHDHFTDPNLNVEKLSQICGISDTYFRKLFFAKFSMTPLKYINQLRMEYARELLQVDYYSIEKISQMCGFNSVYYFIHFVKKQTGLSPTAYQKFISKI